MLSIFNMSIKNMDFYLKNLDDYKSQQYDPKKVVSYLSQ